MNTSNNIKKRKNKRPDGKLSVGDIITLCIYYVAACCFIPAVLCINISTSVVNVAALIMCIISTAIMAKAAGSWKSVAGYAVTVFLVVFLFGAVLPVALFTSFTSAICIYALLLTKHRHPLLYGLPLFPFAISLVFVGGIAGALISVASLPCTLMLIYSVRKKLDRIATVCRMSFGICAVVAAGFLFFLYVKYGKLSLELIRGFMSAAREAVTSNLISASDRMATLMNSTDLPLGDLNAYAATAVSATFNLLPAIIIVIANVLSYFIHSMFLGIYAITDEERKEIYPMLTFDMSLISAIVYLSVLVLSFALVTDKLALWGAVAENMMLILAPGLILTALGALRMITSRKGPSCLGSIIYMLVLFSLLSFSGPAIIIVAAAGAVVIIISHVASKKKKNGNTTD
jgi:hypothetical protein